MTRVAELPIPDKTKAIAKEDYVLDSAHHGLALDPTGEKFCVAGTMSDYGAIVHRDDFSHRIVDDKISKPCWSTNSGDGKYCSISASGNDEVVVISYATEQVVGRFDVGYHPQRVRNGVVPIAQYPQGKVGEAFRFELFKPRARSVGCRATGPTSSSCAAARSLLVTVTAAGSVEASASGPEPGRSGSRCA